MIQGVIGTHGKFRLWSDYIHPAQIDMAEVSEIKIDCVSDNTISCPITRILEVKIPQGARTVYGLLGMRYAQYNADDKLRIFMPKESLGLIYSDSLISFFEAPKIGLLNEYMKASLQGIQRAFASGSVDFASGAFEFSYAAYGDISSNEKIFEKLAFALIGLLKMDVKDVSDDMISTLINS